jgi:hypothetical protein
MRPWSSWVVAAALLATLLAGSPSVASEQTEDEVESGALAGWEQFYFVEGVLGAVPSDDVHDFYVSGQLFGGRGSLTRFLGYGASVLEVVYPGSSEEDVRYALLPVYGHVVPYFSYRASHGAYGGALVDWMTDLYVGGSPIAVVMTGETDPETGEVDSNIDLWWHWYVRGGVRLSRQTEGGTVWGLDVGVDFYDSEDESRGWRSCPYAALTLTFGTIRALSDERED